VCARALIEVVVFGTIKEKGRESDEIALILVFFFISSIGYSFSCDEDEERNVYYNMIKKKAHTLHHTHID
jgi:hypothetical protein